jgi:hypothetical protein
MTNSNKIVGGKKPTAQQEGSLNASSLVDDKDDESLSFNDDDSDDFSGEVSDAFGGDGLDGLFDEGELFDEGGVASLEELGIANLDSNQSSKTGIFRQGRPLNLQAPPPRPGFVQRFIGYLDRQGRKNEKRISASRRDGWLPRKVKPGEFSLPTKKIGGSSIIIIDGQVLCEMRIDRAKQFKLATAAETERNTMAVESQFKEEGRRGNVPVGVENPSLEIKTGTRRPNVGGNRNS